MNELRKKLDELTAGDDGEEEEIYKILRGDQNMTWQTIVRLEAVFGIDFIKTVKIPAAYEALDKVTLQYSR